MTKKEKPPTRWERTAALVDSLAEDILWFGGAVVVAVGAGLVYLPAGLIAFGAACMLPVARRFVRWL